MSDLIVVLNKDSVWELVNATCQLKDICSNQTLRRPESWVIELNALINLFYVETEFDLHYTFRYGRVKVMNYREGVPQLLECKSPEGMVFQIWLQNQQQKLWTQTQTSKSPKKKHN